MAIKVCTKCGVEKDEREFYFNKRTGKPVSECKKCLNNRNNQRSAEKRRAAGKRVREKIVECTKEYILINKNGKVEKLTTKICYICGIEKELNKFQYRSDTHKYRNDCKECNLKRAQISGKKRQENYKIETVSPTKVCSKCNIEKNITQFYFRKEINSHRNECIQCLNSKNNKYRQDNKKIINSRRTERRRNNIILKVRNNISTRIRLALKAKKSYKNGKSILKYLPYTLLELKQHLELQFKSWMCWDNWGVYSADTWNDNDPLTWSWQIDHIIPHSSFNYTSMEDEDFKKCWMLENLRPYSSKQNVIDGNRRNIEKVK
jgi:hypothetical protein